MRPFLPCLHLHQLWSKINAAFLPQRLLVLPSFLFEQAYFSKHCYHWEVDNDKDIGRKSNKSSYSVYTMNCMMFVVQFSIKVKLTLFPLLFVRIVKQIKCPLIVTLKRNSQSVMGIRSSRYQHMQTSTTISTMLTFIFHQLSLDSQLVELESSTEGC